jgi:hypothetical protein
MASFAKDLRSARATVERVLHEIGVEDYVYTVEPKESGWSLRVEYPVHDGWQETRVPLDRDELRASTHDSDARRRLRNAWRPHFAAKLRNLEQPQAKR